jgi:hypothetical protein
MESLKPEGEFGSIGDGMIGMPLRTIFEPDVILANLIAVCRNATAFATVTVEMFVRKNFGTQYINPVTWFSHWFLMQMLYIASLVADPAMHAILGISRRPIGMGWALLGFLAVSLVHAPRLKKRMDNMHLEKHSMEDGTGFGILNRLPKSDDWRNVRVIYEPLLVALVAALGYALHLFEPSLTLYLLFVAFFLSARCSLTFYEWWRQQRVYLDGIAHGEMMMRFMKEGRRPAKNTLHGCVLASLPDTLKKEPVVKPDGGLDPEFLAMLWKDKKDDNDPPMVPAH